MFLPPQTTFGLVLTPLPVTLEATDRRAMSSRSARRVEEEELRRYFPDAWNRDTAADWPAAPPRPVPRPLAESKLVVALASFFRGLWQRAPFRKGALSTAPDSRS
jgi:hypothetical protein